jgi:hypothetical protein
MRERRAHVLREDPVADDITHYDAIEGYTEPQSCLPGDVVRLCASTTSARFDVEVHRWGATREPVWSAEGVTGRQQATPSDADAAGCGWEPLIEIPTDASWRSGFYLVTMTSREAPADRAISYTGFVIRAAAPGRILLVLATNTWNAYNNWGGCSLYTGGKEVSFQRPWGRGMLVRPDVDREDRKSPPRRPGETPDIDGDMYQAFRYEHGFPGYMGSAGWFTYDRRFVEWAEGAGIEIDYAISSDLEQVDGLTDGYRLVIGAGHDEYWSEAGRDTVERFVARGGNYASFSGNTMFWRVRLERSGTSMLCHKYSASETDPIRSADPSAVTGMWADPVCGRTERGFLGAASMYGLYARFGHATPRGVQGFIVYRPDHWLLEGTGLHYGDVLGADEAVLGYETVGTRIAFDDLNLPIAVPDGDVAADALPDDVEIVALTPVSNLGMGEYPASIAALDDQGDLEFVAGRIYGGGERALAKVRHGNAVILTCRPSGSGGGQVVTVGSTDWVFGLAGDADVQRVTANAVHTLSR